MLSLDEGLKNFDYSLLSAIRERLLQRLLTMRQNRRSNITLLNSLMTDDELDYVAAAGVNYVLSKKYNIKGELK